MTIKDVPQDENKKRPQDEKKMAASGCVICLLFLLIGTSSSGSFESFIKDVLVETGAQPASANEYVFAPAEIDMYAI